MMLSEESLPNHLTTNEPSFAANSSNMPLQFYNNSNDSCKEYTIYVTFFSIFLRAPKEPSLQPIQMAQTHKIFGQILSADDQHSTH